MNDEGSDVRASRLTPRPRPTHIEPAGPGQESVWDFPRPPRVENVALLLRVVFQGEVIAETTHGKRVCETAGAPVYYFPPGDVQRYYLTRSGRTSLCEWKGVAGYWTVRVAGITAKDAAFSYDNPFPGFAEIRHYIAFYARPMDACYLGDEQVTPQPGRLYAGWVTKNLVGPIKGEPGTEQW